MVQVRMLSVQRRWESVYQLTCTVDGHKVYGMGDAVKQKMFAFMQSLKGVVL